MIGLLRLAVAVCLAIALSQFPAFSDQYVQRLGGQVDALSRVAAQFDASARAAGLTRDQALAMLARVLTEPVTMFARAIKAVGEKQGGGDVAADAAEPAAETA